MPLTLYIELKSTSFVRLFLQSAAWLLPCQLHLIVMAASVNHEMSGSSFVISRSRSPGAMTKSNTGGCATKNCEAVGLMNSGMSAYVSMVGLSSHRHCAQYLYIIAYWVKVVLDSAGLRLTTMRATILDSFGAR